MSNETFGRRAVKAGSAAELLGLERDGGRADRFEELDRLTGKLLVNALRGGRPLSVAGVERRGRGRPGTLSIGPVPAEQRAMLEELFSVERQESRGTWSLPETFTAKVGVVHFAANLERHERFAHGAIAEDRYKVSSASPDALYYYGVLEPLFDAIYEPFALRGEQVAKKGRDAQIRRWRAVDELFGSLGLEVEGELSVMRYGGGWSRLRAADQVEAKRRLLLALRRQAEPAMASLHRAHRLRPLIARYYGRADREGRALRQRVLTRQFEMTVSAYFGGGWLDFLDYLGEEPHPDEHVATTLPQTKLYLGPARKAMGELGFEGLDEEHLKLIAASLYGGEVSPVQRRIEALERYWEAFDSVHARQRSGMESLWGLVAEDRRVRLTTGNEGPYRHGLYERLLPREVLDDVEELWGSRMVPCAPGRIVTEPFPHTAMAEAFGPALKFWHGCALTAWFLCEGPYSRTDLRGLGGYHRRELEALDQLGTPVDRRLFVELIAAEGRLGPEMPLYQDKIEIEPGLTLEMSFSVGTRREGFEILRDVVTEHRGSWARAHLGGYLSRRAEGEIREAAEAFNRMTHNRSGNSPTPRQFAKPAASPTNHWFGGDISAFYRSFGERSPVTPVRVGVVPKDVRAFVGDVYAALRDTRDRLDWPGGTEERTGTEVAGAQKARGVFDLASLALEYLQLEEVLGRAPTLEELGRSKFERHTRGLLGEDSEVAYATFTRLISDVGRSALDAPENSPNDSCAATDGSGAGIPPTVASHVCRHGPERQGGPSSPQESSLKKPQIEPQERPRRPWWRRLFGG